MLRRSGQGCAVPIALLVVALPRWGRRRFPLGPPPLSATLVPRLPSLLSRPSAPSLLPPPPCLSLFRPPPPSGFFFVFDVVVIRFSFFLVFFFLFFFFSFF